MTATLFPWVRMLHILLAALWLGAGALLTLYLLPTLRRLGVAGQPTLRSLEGLGLSRFMAAIGGLTLLSGLSLYWTLTAGLNADAIRSPTGMVFGIGAVAGILASIVGGGVIGRSIKRLDALGAGSADGPEAIALHRRIAVASRLALALLLVAVVAMSLGHSV
jgi:hypothetical protein